MKRSDCKDPFLLGYLDAALFTTDPSPPGGCDYVECGRADEMFERIPDGFLESAKTDCAAFEERHADLLAQAGDYAQNGADLWYSRNGHGVGFWDRGYAEEVGFLLSKFASELGEHHLELTGWFLNEYCCPKCRAEWTRPEDSDNDPCFGEDVCEKCHAKVESLNRQQGEHMTPIEEPQD